VFALLSLGVLFSNSVVNSYLVFTLGFGAIYLIYGIYFCVCSCKLSCFPKIVSLGDYLAVFYYHGTDGYFIKLLRFLGKLYGTVHKD
jgi:hypothetical protein